MDKIWLILLSLIVVSNSNAQNLYTPRNIQNAYNKTTRSMDGNPGKNYWQNFAKYDITVNASPPNRTISGQEKIVYFNNSPDILRTINIKLFQNIHKIGAARLHDASEDYLNAGIVIDKFFINGVETKYNAPRYDFTNNTLQLSNPLSSHDSIELSFMWHYEISADKEGREGAIDSTSYFLAYFYPRIAVYDDYYGWDRISFNDALEFYSDFNDYNLTVNVPSNFIVWSTGTLLNAQEVLQNSFVQKFRQSLQSDEIINVVSSKDLLNKNVTINNKINSWKWSAKNIPDMALVLSDHYVWDASSVVVDNKTQRRASVQAAYIDTAKDFHSMVSFGRHSLSWLSNNWPGVPYPYEKTTIVQGYAGMEYPMMANDETERDLNEARLTAEHEIAHTWFPFYMGINESRYGFMDEGWATTFELLIGREDVGVNTADKKYKNGRISHWMKDPTAEATIPIITPGSVLGGRSLGNNEYGKPSLAYLALKDLLGDELFKKCLHEYIHRWNGKHPNPWDFFYSINDASGKNLNWFWNNWFFSNGYVDMSIKEVKRTSKKYFISIQNIGGFFAPVDMTITYDDQSKETKHLSPETWKINSLESTMTINSKKKIQSISLDTGVFVDADESNNNWSNQK